MAHYAKVLNGIVQKVIVADSEFFKTFVDDSPGTWLQTSYNTRGGIHYAPNSNTPDNGEAIRANYAGIGYIYNHINDVFHAPRPLDINGNICNSWTLSNVTWLWSAPIAKPNYDGSIYEWNETTQEWVVAVPAQS
jgi:hypothetical protein